MRIRILLLLLLSFINVCFANIPKPWQMGFQEPVTDVMDDIVWFHRLSMYILSGIVFFVIFLITYVCLRFNAKSNPVPAKFKDNLTLEIIWTIIPVIILIILAIPSFKILYHAEHIPKCDFTVKVVGRQWYWSYQYPDHGNFAFDSYIIPDNELKENQLRLLSVDNNIVIPVDTSVRILITSSDVIHSWTIPAFGRKIDAVPGKVNETWIKVKKTGIYYGQCSELCGVNHAFMPIAVEVVTKEEFVEWIKKSQTRFSFNYQQ